MLRSVAQGFRAQATGLGMRLRVRTKSPWRIEAVKGSAGESYMLDKGLQPPVITFPLKSSSFCRALFLSPGQSSSVVTKNMHDFLPYHVQSVNYPNRLMHTGSVSKSCGYVIEGSESIEQVLRCFILGLMTEEGLVRSVKYSRPLS
jgi:hypothetical protein